MNIAQNTAQAINAWMPQLNANQIEWLKSVGIALVVMSVLLLLPQLAQAQTLPWESGTCKAAKAMTGPWIGWVAVIAVAIAAVTWALGESNQAMSTAMRIVAGISIAIGAVSVVGWFFPGQVNSAAC